MHGPPNDSSDDQTDPFQRFMSAFPERDEPDDLQAAREAWGRALERAPAAAVIAGARAYARAGEGQAAGATRGRFLPPPTRPRRLIVGMGRIWDPGMGGLG